MFFISLASVTICKNVSILELSCNRKLTTLKREDQVKAYNSTLISILAMILTLNYAFAQSPKVVPEHEHKIAEQLKLDGPTQTKGIESVELLGTVGLEKDFPALAGKQLRARELVIAPGGVVTVHQHDSRPGVAYILEGEIIEHRNDSTAPLLRRQGAVAFEQSGVAHWWENRSSHPVRALVVDIVNKEK